MTGERAELGDECREGGGVETGIHVFTEGVPPALDEGAYRCVDGGVAAPWNEWRNGTTEVVEGLFVAEDSDGIEEVGGSDVGRAKVVRNGGRGRQDVGEAERRGFHECDGSPRLIRDGPGDLILKRMSGVRLLVFARRAPAAALRVAL